MEVKRLRSHGHKSKLIQIKSWEYSRHMVRFENIATAEDLISGKTHGQKVKIKLENRTERRKLLKRPRV